MERRKAFAKKYGIVKLDYATVDNPFAWRVICGHCGSAFERKVWNSTDERLRRVVWRCNRKYKVKGKKSCDNKHINDRVLYRVFVEAFMPRLKIRIVLWRSGREGYRLRMYW
ncbi:zinc ribbon domain-containing protein [Clostridium sp.]|uniref:zinc ribbon domain-containing protein n=1 Tax=Clostridium sp. TaxID=1506 RepID=UPI002FDDF15F